MKHDRPGVEHLPRRRGLRPRVRHRDRGGILATTALLASKASAVLLDHVPADPVHRWDDADGHDRWHVHELRLLLGLLQPRPKGLLQPRDNRTFCAICFFIGTVEVLGLLPTELGGFHGGFWRYMANFNINKGGFVIVGMFVVCWAAAVAFWRFARVEERWSSRLKDRGVVTEGADA